MPTLGPAELVIILVIVIVLFGASRLAEIGSSLGRGIKEFRKATKEEDEQLKTPAAAAKTEESNKEQA